MAQVVPRTDEVQALLANIQNATKSYTPDSDPVTVYGQRAAIRSAARSLLLAMSSPDDLMWHKLGNLTEAVAIRTALRLGIFRAIPLEGSMSKAELVKKVNATDSLISRIMRVLVSTSLFEQTPEDNYKHTEFSKTFVDPFQPSQGGYWQSMFDIYFKPMHDFDQYMVETAEDGVFSDPVSVFSNPFDKYYKGEGKGMWSILANIPDMSNVFQPQLKMANAMMPPAGPFYDFSQFKATGADDQRVQIVDVGGGFGASLTTILSATPDLDPKKCVLQDLEMVLAEAKAAKAAGVQTQVINFFKEQPVKGAKAYYMRFISHDYHDGELINILSHIHEAMAPDSKLLFADNVVPDRITEASIPVGTLDSIMFCCGGKERTEKEFAEVLDKAGLRLLKIHPMPATTGAIIESVKKTQVNGH